MIAVAGIMMVIRTPGTTRQRATGVQEIAMMALEGAVDGAVVTRATAMIAAAASMTVNGTPRTTMQSHNIQEITIMALGGAVDSAMVIGHPGSPFRATDTKRTVDGAVDTLWYLKVL